MYSLGEGSPLPVNYKEGLRLLRLAADKGFALAIVNTDVLFEHGHLVEAYRLYRHAITLGFEPAKNNLGMLARSGHAPSLAAVRELGLGPL